MKKVFQSITRKFILFKDSVSYKFETWEQTQRAYAAVSPLVLKRGSRVAACLASILLQRRCF